MRNAIVIDCNLLVLLVVGLTSKQLIKKHKRCSQFEEKDFELLEVLLSQASELLVTPNTLSETSNLLKYIAEPARSKILTTFSDFITKSQEHYIESRSAAARNEFIRLGLTDSVLLSLSKPRTIILTTDLDLYLAALNAGLEAFNFFHIKESQAYLQ